MMPPPPPLSSRHFRSMRNFLYFFSTKWLPAAILDGRKSLSIAFLAISDQYAFFHKMAASGHFGLPKITFDRISRHFRSIRNFDFFSQNGCRRPFWMSENRFRAHFSPFQINTQLLIFFKFTKWLPATILDDRKSLSNAFLAISDQKNNSNT